VSRPGDATCPPYGLPRVASWLAHVSCTALPCHLYGLPCVASWLAHVSCTDMPRVLYGRATWTVRTVQSSPFFACLPFRTERDIFSIRTPFDEVNIPPESGRRDGRNGTGFVAFRALSFLSIFQALSGFWIRFRITPPHNKTFWSPKGY
jgi:hypothetical protein